LSYVYCRVLGSLLSAHLIIKDPLQPFGELSSRDYNDELLHLAHDLGARLLAAFENTATGIPHPRVSIVVADEILFLMQRVSCEDKCTSDSAAEQLIILIV